MTDKKRQNRNGLGRRDFLKAAGLAGVGAAVGLGGVAR